MSLLTKNGKLLTADGNAINQKGMTPLEVEDLINKKIIDLGTFATNRPIEEGLKEFFIEAEKLNLDYYDNRIFIGMVADTKVMAIGQAGGDLAVYTEKFEQYIVGYDDADLLAVRHEPSKVRNVGAFETSTIEDGLKQFALTVVRYHINYNKYGTITCLYTGEIAGDIPVFTWYNGDDVMNVYTPNTTYKITNLFDEENIKVTDLTKTPQFFNFNKADVEEFSAIDVQAPQVLKKNTIVNWYPDFRESDMIELQCNTNQVAIQINNAPNFININFKNSTATGTPCMINRSRFKIDNFNHMSSFSNGCIELEGISSLDVSSDSDYLTLTYDVNADTIIIDHAYYGEL